MKEQTFAEQAVIGSMLIDSACVDDVLQILRPEDFGSDTLQKFFEAFRELREAGMDPDPVLVVDRIGEYEQYALELMNITPTAANVRLYCSVVKAQAQRRRVQQAIEDLNFGLFDNVNDLREKLQEVLNEIDSQPDDVVADGEKSAANWLAWIQMVQQDLGNALVTSGFPSLDRMLGGGFFRSGFYVIGARPGMGKTTLALNMANRIARSRKRVLFVSLEMDGNQITAKRLAIWTGLPYNALYTGRLNDEDLNAVGPALEWFRELPFYTSDSGIYTVSDLAKHSISGLYDVIFVDYLGIMTPEAEDAQRTKYEQISNLSKSLKALAKQAKIPIIALSQLNRESASKSNKRPTLAELRDSGAIEQDADGVILLHREGYYSEEKPETEKIELILAKNRHGETGTLLLTWWARSGQITEISFREE